MKKDQKINHFDCQKIQQQDPWSQSEPIYQNDSEEFSFGQFLKKQKLRKRKGKIQYLKKIKIAGFWSVQQNKIYLEFLKRNKRFFESQKSKRSSKIFRKMSNDIKTRSSLQCRSHHQKYESSHPNIDDLISFLTRKYTTQMRVLSEHQQIKENYFESLNNQNEGKRANVKIIQGSDQPLSPLNNSTVDEQSKEPWYKMKIEIISSWMEIYP